MKNKILSPTITNHFYCITFAHTVKSTNNNTFLNISNNLTNKVAHLIMTTLYINFCAYIIEN